MTIDIKAVRALNKALAIGEIRGRHIDALIWQVFHPDAEVMVDGGDPRTKRPGVYVPFSTLDIREWPVETQASIADIVGATQITASIDDAMTFAAEIVGSAAAMTMLVEATDAASGVDKIASLLTKRVVQYYERSASAAISASLRR